MKVRARTEDDIEERFQQCATLETRRIRGDQIEVYEISIDIIEGLNIDMFFI